MALSGLDIPVFSSCNDCFLSKDEVLVFKIDLRKVGSEEQSPQNLSAKLSSEKKSNLDIEGGGLSNESVRVGKPNVSGDFIGAYANLIGMLTDKEKGHASRFHFAKDRNRYITSKAGLRFILSKFLGVSPLDIELGKTSEGKPFVKPELNPRNIRYNVSHAGDCVLYAFSIDHELGVDVEYSDRKIDAVGIAKRFFSKIESDFLLSLEEMDRHDAFYRMWVAKEAYVKAIGSGLRHALDKFTVDLMNKELIVHGQDSHGWQLKMFIPQEECVGALVVPSNIKKVRYVYVMD